MPFMINGAHQNLHMKFGDDHSLSDNLSKNKLFGYPAGVRLV